MRIACAMMACVLPVAALAAQAAKPAVTVDNPVALRPAKVVINMDHDVFTGKVPTGLFYMQLLLGNYRGSTQPLSLVALLHSHAAYMMLDDAAYDRTEHVQHGNPYKRMIADLQKAGVRFEICSVTMGLNGWGNADLLPAVKVDEDVLLQLIYLTQDGWVVVQP